MPKRYFTRLNHSTQPKNKLQKEIWAEFENLSNRIVNDIDLAVVQARDMVYDLCGKNPKCQRMDLRENRDKDSVILYVRSLNDQGPGLNFVYHLIKEK